MEKKTKLYFKVSMYLFLLTFDLKIYAFSNKSEKLINSDVKILNVNNLDRSSDGIIPAPLPDLNGLKQYAKQNSGNLPNVYGKLNLNTVQLNEAFTSGGFKNFPIQLNCMQEPLCNTRLEIGDMGNGLLHIVASDNLTNKKADVSIKLSTENGSPINMSNLAYTLEQPNMNEIIGTDNIIDVSPYFSYQFSKPISYIQLPLVPNSFYQICDGKGENCSPKKQLFDAMFSGNKVEYLSFWKLEQKGYLSPDTSQSFQFSYSTGLTDTTSTTLSWSIGLKIPIKAGDLSGTIGQAINKTVSFQDSTTVTNTVTFDKPETQSTIGEYVLYIGVNDNFPVVDELISELNKKFENNSEFTFSKAQDYFDSKSNSGITSGTTAFMNSKENEPKMLVTWPVSVPSL
ncbi:hypothetical protein QEJ31_00460 [Pigmentibacter sp. JX0631]|uniref:hypothetical protein n=1 Tax=Pigmentibacter sp. JX0631 TaxID=2976982 RepID=UPI00246940C1|nr:hypothetical protein [Pigmentibacter sp. JX0631]WGL60074.1 hypothetical protein QEJ31_00460 [Pigmentibacter sp. JX0631]